MILHTRISATRLPDDTIVFELRTAATPTEVEEALECARALARAQRKRLLLVVGALDVPARLLAYEHARLGRLAAENAVASVVAVGEEACRVALEALACGLDAWAVPDAASAAARILAVRRPGDVVLVIGARSGPLDDVAHAVMSDRPEPRGTTS
jgi:UDP-N-acetylmuramyl pentapeptide synthase